jgi:multidrug transporter EmrE-like cation transporter
MGDVTAPGAAPTTVPDPHPSSRSSKERSVVYALLAVAVVANVLSNISFKLGMKGAPPLDSLPNLVSVALRPWLWIGAISAGVLLASYLALLKRIDVSLAYPLVTCLALVGISAVAMAGLGEHSDWTRRLGLLLIAAGLLMLMRSMPAASPLP